MKYAIAMLALCIGITIATIVVLLPFSIFPVIPLIVGALISAVLLLLLYFIGKEVSMPKEALKRFFPFFIPIIVLFLIMLIQLLKNWAPFSLDNYGMITGLYFYIAIGAIPLLTAIGLTIGERFSGKSIKLNWKRFWLLPCTAILLGSLIFGLDNYHTSHTFRTGGRGDRITEELRLYYYTPFTTDNLLIKADFTPSLIISGDYPRLDGATAAYPVYAAMAETIYRGLDSTTIKNYVECSRTDGAFDRLIAGDADIIFGVQPSNEQLAAAQEAGVELIAVKVSLEAFVFFVNTANPVNDLSIEQIQKIYTEEIVNWSDLGSKKGDIIPYQRPKNSGSQTIMENVVMRGITMAPPIIEHISGFMGGIMDDVASYHGYSGAIGYSFRYYTTVMNPHERLKILSVNGIEPSIENIQNSIYPFTVDVYAYTTKQALENPNVKNLFDWITTEEGQRLIELCGYVPIL